MKTTDELVEALDEVAPVALVPVRLLALTASRLTTLQGDRDSLYEQALVWGDHRAKLRALCKTVNDHAGGDDDTRLPCLTVKQVLAILDGTL